MKKVVFGTALILGVAILQLASAQDALTSAAQTAVLDEQPVHLKAQIVSIDRAARVLTLRGPQGNQVDITVGPQADNLATLEVGDTVELLYKNALLVTAQRVTGGAKGVRERVDTRVSLPAASGYDAAHQVEVEATVEKIDSKTRHVTLRGAYRTVTLDASKDVNLDQLKVGDTIHAVFVSAYAVRVTPVTAAQ
ncbi:MAG: hypothetical protein WCA85_32460 [Paraburkholderia sp.]|uniref:hypothetical protein n=1 Tax=Paraburkholderia sp. TaxID=1926495 RepID=UPI003C36100D